MRILITGGFGFVGGRLAQHFWRTGHHVVLGSREARPRPDWLSKSEVIKVNWSDDDALEEACCGVDVVIHAAGMNAKDCSADPVAALEVNGVATARLVRVAIKAHVKRLIYLSTAHVYASPLVGTITEDVCPRNLHPYAASHLAGENAVFNASRQKKIEGLVLRMSNAFGSPTHKDVDCWTLLVNDLCRQVVETGKMTLRSSGVQHRDFVSMAEVCRISGHLSSCAVGSSMPDVFNVGAGVSRSVFEMAQLIQQRCKVVLGFKPELCRLITVDDETHENLIYRTQALTAMGINLEIDNNTEIDGLLAFCQASFENKNVNV
jgi:UDP-glucose 4-epimerase